MIFMHFLRCLGHVFFGKIHTARIYFFQNLNRTNLIHPLYLYRTFLADRRNCSLVLIIKLGPCVLKLSFFHHWWVYNPTPPGNESKFNQSLCKTPDSSALKGFTQIAIIAGSILFHRDSFFQGAILWRVMRNRAL